MTLTQAIAAEVRDRATGSGLLSRQVAAALDMAEISYSHRLRGEIDWRLDELERLAGIFGTEVDELLSAARARRSAA